MKKNRPIISIGIPVYNGEKTIGRTLESLIEQTYANFEVFISDNCSTDFTEEICKDYVCRDSRFNFHKQIRNFGPEFNFKYVLDSSRGQYFLWLAADDYIERNYLEILLAKHVEYVNSHNPIGLVCGLPILFRDNIQRTGRNPSYTSSSPLIRAVKYGYNYNDGSMIYGMFNLCELKKFTDKKLNGAYQNYGGDYLLLFEFLLKNKADFVGNAIIYRSSEGGSSKLKFIDKFRLNYSLCIHIIKCGFGPNIERNQRLAWVFGGLTALTKRLFILLAVEVKKTIYD